MLSLLPELVLLNTIDPESPPTVNAAMFSQDGSMILTAVGDDYNSGWSLWLWDARTGTPVALIVDDDPLCWRDVRQTLAPSDLLILHSLPGLPICAVLSDDGLSIACAHGVGVSLWQLSAQSGTPKLCVERWRSTRPEAIYYSLIDRAQLQRSQRSLSPELQAQQDRFVEPTYSVYHLCWRPGQAELLLITRDGVAQLWNPFTGRMLRLFQKDDAFITEAAFDSAGSRLATTATDGRLQIWDVATARLMSECLLPEIANSVAWSPTSSHILTTHRHRNPHLWDLAQDRWFTLQDGERLVGCHTAAFRGDGAVVALVSTDNAVELWNVFQLDRIVTLMIDDKRFSVALDIPMPHAGWFAHLLDWRHDGQKLLVGGTNALTWLWEVAQFGDGQDLPGVISTGATGRAADDDRAVTRELRLLMSQPIDTHIGNELRRIGEPAVLPLLTALQHTDAHTRRWAAWGLGQLAEQRAIGPLAAALHDSDWHVRASAAEALGQVGDTRAVEPLLQALANPAFGVRGSVMRSLGKLGDTRAIPALIQAVADVGAQAVWALADFGQPAVQPIIEALARADADTQPLLIEALGLIGDEQALDHLL